MIIFCCRIYRIRTAWFEDAQLFLTYKLYIGIACYANDVKSNTFLQPTSDSRGIQTTLNLQGRYQFVLERDQCHPGYSDHRQVPELQLLLVGVLMVWIYIFKHKELFIDLVCICGCFDFEQASENITLRKNSKKYLLEIISQTGFK